MLLSLLLIVAALPEQVTLKTPTETFTATHDLALVAGRIWWRPHGAQWSLLPPDGLPVPHGRLEALKELASGLPAAPRPFHRPARIESLSADGDNLIAISPEGLVYYAKLSTLEWVDMWGPTGMEKPLSVKDLDAVAMSHRMIAYEDIDGNPHPVSAGVTTFFALRNGGKALAYADPWLPANFDRTLWLPERDRFVASALSASASTLFVMDAAGRSFTRLVDFDIQGDNPVLPYSYKRERRTGKKSTTRSLPGPDWVAQPMIPGKHTTHLTILQTGPTNADRELRVEGEGGYWKKSVDAKAWEFVTATLPTPTLPWVTRGTPPQSPSQDVELIANEPWPGTRVTLRNFNPHCAPAVLHVENGSEVLDLELPFRFSIFFGTDDERTLKGALLLPKGKSPWLSKLRVMALGADQLEVELHVSKREVRVTHLPAFDLTFAR